MSRPIDPVLQCRSACATLQLAPLAFAEAAPDPEALVVVQGVLEAFATHIARRADALRVTRRAALFGEERLRVGLRAQRVDLS